METFDSHDDLRYPTRMMKVITTTTNYSVNSLDTVRQILAALLVRAECA
jgi:hypothetical protein